MIDTRNKAVISIAPEGFWLFGARGLDTVDCPTMIITGTNDDIHYYDLEAVNIFDNLGTSDKTMISFVDIGQKMLFSDDEVSIMKHFAVAFFGYYLQSKEDYIGYFSEDFVT